MWVINKCDLMKWPLFIHWVIKVIRGDPTAMRMSQNRTQCNHLSSLLREKKSTSYIFLDKGILLTLAFWVNTRVLQSVKKITPLLGNPINIP